MTDNDSLPLDYTGILFNGQFTFSNWTDDKEARGSKLTFEKNPSGYIDPVMKQLEVMILKCIEGILLSYHLSLYSSRSYLFWCIHEVSSSSLCKPASITLKINLKIHLFHKYVSLSPLRFIVYSTTNTLYSNQCFDILVSLFPLYKADASFSLFHLTA